jgi:GntR family transcriptional regulator, arabinose operon transcriptional repressor
VEKHRKIREELELNIASGVYPPGSRMPTEMQLCEQFGAARATVARALRTLEDGRLIVRRRGAGTFVRSAESVIETKRIGLLVPGIGDGEIFAPICASIAAYATQFGLRISWNQLPDIQPENKADAALAMCKQYINEGVDGLFFEPLELVGDKDDTNRRIIQLLRDAGIPVVLIDSDLAYPQRSDFDLAGIDNFRAGILLAEHILDRGCRALVFLHRPGSAPTTKARAAGFLSVLASNGLPTKGRIVEAEPDDPALVARLTVKLKADAVVCGNDYTAARLIKNLQAAGIRIPGQIKLTGVDDLKYSQLLSVPLTTLAQPCRDIGIAALDLMRFRIDHPAAPPRQILHEAPLIERESTARL